ncbi:MAG: nucleotidyltransferase family protein, partial [Candidatus Omnitrophica bacterium]|nr:nucleotidyltransferase family protein [Candidatus Omnitrophota bacterium]
MDFPELVQCLLKNEQPVHCYREDCFWLDIGRVEDYRLANEIIETRKSEFIPEK